MILRFFFIISFMVWAVMQDQFLLMLMQLLFCIVFLSVKGVSRLLFVRSLALLLWLFLPIFFFHGVFTPGTYIQTPIYIPLSHEGLARASMLCLHITLIFFSALLMFRVVKVSEYDAMLTWISPMSVIHLYLILMEPLKKEIVRTLDESRLAWMNMEGRWGKLPDTLGFCVESIVIGSKRQAELLWKNWDASIFEKKASRESVFSFARRDILYGVFTSSVWTLWWVL